MRKGQVVRYVNQTKPRQWRMYPVSKTRGGGGHDVLTRAAIVTGWKALSNIQFNYIRDAARRMMVSTNIIGTTNVDPQSLEASFKGAITSPGRPNTFKQMNSFEYHGRDLTPIKPKKPKSYVYLIKGILLKEFEVKEASKRANQRYIHSLYSWAIIQHGQKIHDMHPDKYSSTSNTNKRSLFWTLGYDDIERRTKANPELMSSIADEFIDMIKKGNRTKTVLREPPARKRNKLSRPQIASKAGLKRERREWAKEEDTLLLEQLSKGKNSAEISELLPLRTAKDIRLHVGYLNRKRIKEGKPLLLLPSRQPPLAEPSTQVSASIRLLDEDSEDYWSIGMETES